MTSEKELLDLFPKRLANERQWVVRGSDGRYVEHFKKFNVVAIGHLDKGLPDSKNSPSEYSREKIKKALSQPDLKGNLPSKSGVTNQANQAETFLHVMKEGDLVLTLDDKQVAIGRLSGLPYFSADSLEIQTPGQLKAHRMPYRTRRNVVWEHSFPRSDLPLNVEYSFRAHQTVFNADRHWEHIYHLMYPYFADDKAIYLSGMIRQSQDIDSHSVLRLLAFFSDIEIGLKSFNFGENTDLATLSANFVEAGYRHELICRAQFFSQGPIWWKQPIQWVKDYRKTVIIILAFQALFGGKFIGVEFPGFITPAMREEALKFVLSIYEKHQMEEVVKGLLLDYPRHPVLPAARPIQI